MVGWEHGALHTQSDENGAAELLGGYSFRDRERAEVEREAEAHYPPPRQGDRYPRLVALSYCGATFRIRPHLLISAKTSQEVADG